MDQIIESALSRRKEYLGLTGPQAVAQLNIYGYNQGVSAEKTGWLKRLAGIFGEPMMMLLLATGAVYFFLGQMTEAVVVWASILPIGVIEFFEEKRTDKAIAILDKMAVKYAKVYRDKELTDLEFKEIAPGDLIYLTAGDQVAADGYLLRSAGLFVDESVLTGESLPVIKREVADEDKEIKPDNGLKQGTMVVQGEGFMLAVATGVNTEYGALGGLLKKIKRVDTPLQKKINRFVRYLAVAALFFALAIGILLGFYQGWVPGLLGGLTMAMSIIPEEFPVVFSVFLIMGMWRLSRQKALVREMVMVETLGSATVICSDKTGTLTEGRMSLERIYYRGRIHQLRPGEETSAEFGPLIRSALLGLERVATDPIEVEVQKFAASVGIDTKQFFSRHNLLKDSSFNAKQKLVHHIWKNEEAECFQYTVGAPESVLAISQMERVALKQAAAANDTLAAAGFRVIGVARRPCSPHEEITMKGMEFMGFLAMSDPPRPGVKEAVAECQAAGIRVMMITGDNKLTAHNIAESVGMKHNEEILNGDDLEKMSKEALKEAARRHNIFARVQPEQKYLIVRALQESGEVVAMTGDGVNDAPALRQADIGIAMGIRGTDVARAAAGMVLMDDNFSSIVNAVREGRRIYRNMREAFVFLLSFHIPIIVLAVLSLAVNKEMFFSPIQIIFLELICDPAAVLGFEREKAAKNIMTVPPRPAAEPLINPSAWWKIFIKSFSITAVSFSFYYYYAVMVGDQALGRTAAFATLVLVQIFLIIFSREWSQIRENRLLLGITVFILAALAVILWVGVVRRLFGFIVLDWSQLSLTLIASLAAAGSVSWFVKRRYAKR